MPQDLIEMREDFWDYYELLVPLDDRTFQFGNGIRNPDNFADAKMVEGFVDSRNQGWVKVEFGRLEYTWMTFEEAWEEDSVQLVHKIFYNGWIYEDCFWWKVKDMPTVLKEAEVVEVDSDSETDTELDSVDEKGIFDTDESSEEDSISDISEVASDTSMSEQEQDGSNWIIRYRFE